VWHVFSVRVSDRDSLRKQLAEQNITTGIHYPIPLHEQPAYKHLGIEKGALPVTERVCRQLVSLPMYPELKISQLETVVNALTSDKALFASQ
jgi:dTDP-4-amino-4,6-dideoxygalactose transaminase